MRGELEQKRERLLTKEDGVSCGIVDDLTQTDDIFMRTFLHDGNFSENFLVSSVRGGEGLAQAAFSFGSAFDDLDGLMKVSGSRHKRSTHYIPQFLWSLCRHPVELCRECPCRSRDGPRTG